MKAIYFYVLLITAVATFSHYCAPKSTSLVDTYHQSLEAAVGQKVK